MEVLHIADSLAARPLLRGERGGRLSRRTVQRIVARALTSAARGAVRDLSQLDR